MKREDAKRNGTWEPHCAPRTKAVWKHQVWRSEQDAVPTHGQSHCWGLLEYRLNHLSVYYYAGLNPDIFVLKLFC